MFRFDDPRSEFGVLYASSTPEGAFVETLVRDRREPGKPATLALGSLHERRLTEITTEEPLRLVDLTGAGLSRLGLDNRITTLDGALAREWSRGFFLHPALPDGLLYRSRLNPSLYCVALFDRSRQGLSWKDLGLLDSPKNSRLIAPLLERYHLAI